MKELDIEEILTAARQDRWSDDELVTRSVALAESLSQHVRSAINRPAKSQIALHAALMAESQTNAFVRSLCDRLLATDFIAEYHPQSNTLTTLRHTVFDRVVKQYGIPRNLPARHKFFLQSAYHLCRIAPNITVPWLMRYARSYYTAFVVAATDKPLFRQLRKLHKTGFCTSLAPIGEHAHSHAECDQYLQQLQAAIANKTCQGVSVKASALCPRLNPIAFQAGVDAIQERLGALFRTVLQQGNRVPVHVDAESFRFLHMTLQAFKNILLEPELLAVEAGITVQAYLPESEHILTDLYTVAKERVEQGGAKIKIRLVKGAYLAAETAHAANTALPQVTYTAKEQTDANYKKLLHLACSQKYTRYIRLGIATHNVFDICYALLLREREQVQEFVRFEMLYSITPVLASILNQVSHDVLLYTPAVTPQRLYTAAPYVIRRRQQTEQANNFAAVWADLVPGTAAWDTQKKAFLQACHDRVTVKNTLHRNNHAEGGKVTHYRDAFMHARLADWSYPAVTAQFTQALQQFTPPAAPIPLHIHGREVTTKLLGVSRNPSCNSQVLYKFTYADFECVELVLQTAAVAQESWQKTGITARADLLHKAAQEIEKIRTAATIAMVQDIAMPAESADIEVQTAADFCRYYAESLDQDGLQDGVVASPLGTVCVVSPFDSPFANPAGLLAATLMAGNTVIFKPSEQAVYPAWLLAQAFWQAGVPQQVLQFMPVPRNEIADKLFKDARLHGIAGTGTYATALALQQYDGTRHFSFAAERKNGIIVTAMANLAQAARDLADHAFDYAGQSAAATTFVFVESSILPAFMALLREYVQTLAVGSAIDPNNAVTPLITEPESATLAAMTELFEHEEWLLVPQQHPDNSCLWSPGIRLCNNPTERLQQAEYLAPVINIIPVKNTSAAINYQNELNCALAAGIYSLDPAEIADWQNAVRAGNLFINHPLHTAIAQRNPFGGAKHSHVGDMYQFGGKNFILPFLQHTETDVPQKLRTPGERIAGLVEKLCTVLPESAQRIRASAGSQAKWWQEEFGIEHTPERLPGQTVTCRYVPLKSLLARTDSMQKSDIAILLLATKLTGIELHLSTPATQDWLTALQGHYATLHVETEQELTQRLALSPSELDKIRCLNPGSLLQQTARELDIEILTRPVFTNGRFELLCHTQEQCIVQKRY